MKPRRATSYFWVSYADLMTSLFFVMLVLFSIVFVKMNRNLAETKGEKDTVDSLNVVLEEQRKKIEEIENAIKAIDRRYFTYDEGLKKHRMTIDVQFPSAKYDIEGNIPYGIQQKLLAAGKAIAHFVEIQREKNPEVKYLLVIEGQASRDGNEMDNYTLSYNRALSLRQFWQRHNIDFDEERCEVLVSGSGIYGQGRDPNNDLLNRRFIIHIMPKPGMRQNL